MLLDKKQSILNIFVTSLSVTLILFVVLFYSGENALATHDGQPDGTTTACGQTTQQPQDICQNTNATAKGPYCYRQSGTVSCGELCGGSSCCSPPPQVPLEWWAHYTTDFYHTVNSGGTCASNGTSCSYNSAICNWAQTVSVVGCGCVSGGGNPPSVTLTASPNTVSEGGSSTLTWTVSGGADSCTASGDWSGSKSTSGSSETKSNLQSNKTYTLSCSNSDGSGSDTETVTVDDDEEECNAGPGTNQLTGCIYEDKELQGDVVGTAPTQPVASDPDNYVATSEDWGSGCIISGECNSFSVRTKGDFNLQGGDYTFIVGGPNGGTHDDGFRLFIDKGDGSGLVQVSQESEWTTKDHRHTYSVNNVVAGTRRIQYEYNERGEDARTYLSWTRDPDDPPTVSIGGSPNPVDSGNSSTLTWSSTDATSCTAGASPINPNWTGSKATSGNQSTGALTQTTTFTLTCNGPGGSGGSNTTVTVNPVVQNYTLNVVRNGQGTVTSQPSGISCGSSCSASFLEDTSITLTATPISGWRFVNWSGDCSGTINSCNLTMNGTKSVTAKFRPNLDLREF